MYRELDCGELFDRLDVRSKSTEEEARYWMHQIFNGLENLQRSGICHRDVSLENLLVHKDCIFLIIDMGVSDNTLRRQWIRRQGYVYFH